MMVNKRLVSVLEFNSLNLGPGAPGVANPHQDLGPFPDTLATAAWHPQTVSVPLIFILFGNLLKYCWINFKGHLGIYESLGFETLTSYVWSLRQNVLVRTAWRQAEVKAKTRRFDSRTSGNTPFQAKTTGLRCFAKRGVKWKYYFSITAEGTKLEWFPSCSIKMNTCRRTHFWNNVKLPTDTHKLVLLTNRWHFWKCWQTSYCPSQIFVNNWFLFSSINFFTINLNEALAKTKYLWGECRGR